MSRQFTWWRRFYSTQKLDTKQMYKAASKLLQRIEAGEFEHDGLWDESLLEEEIFEQQFEEFKQKHPKGSQDLYDHAYVNLRKKKNKRVNIMRDHHLKHELTLLYNLKEDLAKEFNMDSDTVWETMEEFDGTTRELYFFLKDKSLGKEPRTPEQIAQVPRMFNQQPRHILKRANYKYLPLWRKILSKYNFHFAYPYE